MEGVKTKLEIPVEGILEIVGHCAKEDLIKLRESAEKLNQMDNTHTYIYSVVRNPRGKEYGYYLVREKVW
ncbi:unnamed protein product [marine sediment metagenome]|uniref:Uncharacterized protein n=1 Tax=marine sediment metagenome TaxID=412755 RepID=X1SH10_9ZZZZ